MPYNAGSIVGYIQLNKSAWDAPIRSVKGDVANLTRLSENLGRKMLALSATIIGVGTIAVREFSKFEHAMRISTSVSNATEKEFAQASEKAIEVSKRWNVAATTVANAYLYLGRAGLTMAEQMKAVEPIVLASKAMLTDLEDTTEGVINIIRAFNYTFEDTAQIVGQVTYAANKSTQSLDDILVALSYAGKPAQAANTSFQQLAAALSIAANQGIRGSKAGVALRFAFTSLMRPTADVMRILQKYNIQVYDSEMRMKPLPDLLEAIEKGLANLSEKRRNEALATMVGTRATSTWLALLSQGSGEVRKWTENINKAGNEAEDVAKAQLKALAEKWGQIKKGIQAVVYALVDQFTPGLKSASDKLIEFTTKTKDWIKANKNQVKEMVKSIANFGLLVGKIGLVLLILPKIVNLSASLLSAFTNPFIIIPGIIYGLSVIFREGLDQMFDDLKKFMKDVDDATWEWRLKQANKIGPVGRLTAGTAAGALGGSLFGPVGATIGAMGGAGITGYSMLKERKMGLLDERGNPILGRWKNQFPLAKPKWSDSKEILNRYIDIATKDVDWAKGKLGGFAKNALSPEQLAFIEKAMKIFDDLANTIANIGNTAEDTEPPVKKLIETLGGGGDKAKFRGDLDKFIAAWEEAKNNITDGLISIQETMEGVVNGMSDAFRDGFRDWIGGAESFAGLFQNILNRMKNMFLDFIATITTNTIMAKLGFASEGTMTWGRGIAAFQQGGGFSGIWNSLFPAPTSGPGTGYPSGYTGPLSKAVPSDFSGGGRMAKPAITFNITNEIPGAELAVVSAETQADRTVLNATMRLASSNTMFRRTFVNPGGR
jgi:TP901 family phage tail tape measure protein